MKLRACLLIAVASGLVACAASTPETRVIVVTATPSAVLSDTPAAVPSPEPTVYVVARGDNLSRIARAFGVTVEDLVELNQIENPDRIEVGQVLVIPTPVAVALAEATIQTPTPPAATSTPTETPTETATATAPVPPSPTLSATATATRPPTATPVPTLRRRVVVSPTPPPPATATATSAPTVTSTATATSSPTSVPVVPTETATQPTTASATVTPVAPPTLPATPAGAAINETPEDQALAAAMLEALEPYEVQRLVIADARDQGGARVAIGTLFLTAEQEGSEEELSLPLGAIFVTAYQVVLAAGEGVELDSVAVVIATADGNAAALIGARLPDVAEFVEGELSEADFVARWVVRQF